MRLSELEKTPADGAQFSDAPPAAAQPKNYAAWEKDFLQGIVANQRLQIFRCPSLKAISKPGESEAEFKARLRWPHAKVAMLRLKRCGRNTRPRSPPCRRDLHVPRRRSSDKKNRPPTRGFRPRFP